MKVRVSATVDEDVEQLLDYICKNSCLRNKSHAMELAIEILAKEVKNGKYKK